MLLEIERRPVGKSGAAGRGGNLKHGLSSWHQPARTYDLLRSQGNGL
jgi:hypothetical protein